MTFQRRENANIKYVSIDTEPNWSEEYKCIHPVLQPWERESIVDHLPVPLYGSALAEALGKKMRSHQEDVASHGKSFFRSISSFSVGHLSSFPALSWPVKSSVKHLASLGFICIIYEGNALETPSK